jgi:hypothetical protein
LRWIDVRGLKNCRFVIPNGLIACQGPDNV